ncbi:multiplied multi-transmembrane transporter-like protein [Babesia gibsoni]|uniref:Multiplied multi-transmembrane transporter-like protein n=1 Tax=Babesia gibsoni TaxID=33632 RepID=A0AAD8LRV3_BABGI|nr:multiplied multi-transmembrane transporter-like protein [Babesia gibsoni]
MTQDNKKYTIPAIVLYHLVTFLEGFNLQCTPVCMRAFEMSLGLTASRLSVVFATELLSLLGIAAVWGTGVLVCRFLHGAGLSCVGPVYSKIITEHYGNNNQSQGKDETSTWFSVANGAHCAGKVLSLMLVSVLATRNILGQYGWRLCYCLTGYVWLMVAVVVLFFMEKEGGGSDSSDSSDSASSGTKKPFYQTYTFWVMACVMYTSETPFVMLGYMVMYFQYSGLSNKMAGFVGAIIQIAAVIGSCAGGYAAQECHKKWKKEKGYGRFTFAMSVLAWRFLAVISILFRPIESGVLRWYHWVELFVFGLTLFVASAVDRPTVTDIADKQGALAGSLFRVAGGVPASATISPIIALLAERFGYIESKELLEDMDIQTRMANVNALRLSLMCVGGVLTVLNIILYIPVFFTYGNDKDQTGGSGGTDNCNSTTDESSGSPGTSKVTYPWYAIVLYHVFTFLDSYSTQSLYVCMGAFEVDLGISPSSLSIVAMAHMLSELGLSPLWGYLVDNKESHYVECIAMLIIGTTSIVLACTSCYPLILVLRFLHGASLGCTGPVIQKIITGSRKECEQATWFGIYAAVFGLGSLIGCATNSLLSMKNLLGLYGWRLSYCMLGYAWLLTAPLVFKFMRPSSNASGASQNGNETIVKKLKCIFIKNSYWLLVAVMFASEAAYAFMAYIPLYLQYSGLSEMAIAFLCAVVVFGGMFGGLFGGKLIDWCHEKSAEYGRLGFAVAALVVRLVYITWLLILSIPETGLTWKHYGKAFTVGATLVTIHSVDRPMLQDVVPKGSEGTALSFLRMIAGIPSSLFFPPLIANLAERVYGYVKGAGFGEGADRAVMASNANALRRSIMYIMICATAVNVALYIGLFFTYKKDKKDKGTGGKRNKGKRTPERRWGTGIPGLTMLVSPTIEKPIVSDLEKDAASITVPLYRAIGGMPSYFVIMPLFGWMAEKMYGYVKPSGDVSQLGHMVMSVNANALRKSMMWILSIATILNIGLYVVVHYAEKLGKALKPASCPTTTTPTPTTTTSSSSNEITYHWYARVLCFVPAFVQGVNLQLLPICMRAFEITLGLSPSRLSWIPSVQIMFYLGVSPLWGILLDNLNRKVGDVQCIATCLCGISCILLGYVSHYPLVMLFTVLNGCGNAACIAVAPKMINEDKRMKEQPTLCAIGGVASNASVVPAVGYLCEKKFGYVTSTEGGGTLPPEVMANNVSALRKSMLIVFVVCSIINIALYLVALATYKNDKVKEDNKQASACPATAAQAASENKCGEESSKEDKTTATYTWYGKVLYHVYPVMDAIDMEILPICMRAFEVSFGLSPATLSLVGAAEQGAVLFKESTLGILAGH